MIDYFRAEKISACDTFRFRAMVAAMASNPYPPFYCFFRARAYLSTWTGFRSCAGAYSYHFFGLMSVASQVGNGWRDELG